MIMSFAFQLFEPKKPRNTKNDDPLIEVRPNGRIVFNKKAAELLDNRRFCMLGYDSGNEAVGILPLEEPKTNCFPIRFAAKGAYIGAKRFFKYFNILPADLIENPPIQSGEFLGIPLNNH